MIEEYKYPDILYCIACNEDVEPEIVTLTHELEREDGLRFTFEYPVAVCPTCGSELCRRGFDYAYAKAVIEHGAMF